jgi:hypothetical protein
VPYYYNRDGRSWDKVSYIAKNWMPSHLNVKVQYAYLSADLWSVGDAFFEPEIRDINDEIDEGIVDTTNQIYTTDENHYLVSEDSTIILYN